jgi:hypothetical protein
MTTAFTNKPWSRFPITHCPEVKEGAIEHHRRTYKDFQVHWYTDGSGIDGKIGAATVKAASKTTLMACLGSDEEYLVYDGEALALTLAMKAIADADDMKTPVIYMDN